MKNSLIAALIALVASSCAQYKTAPGKKYSETSSSSKIQIKNFDMNAKSGPITGHNYYRLPPSAPTLEKKEQTSKNTKTKTTTTTKKVFKK